MKIPRAFNKLSYFVVGLVIMSSHASVFASESISEYKEKKSYLQDGKIIFVESQDSYTNFSEFNKNYDKTAWENGLKGGNPCKVLGFDCKQAPGNPTYLRPYDNKTFDIYEAQADSGFEVRDNSSKSYFYLNDGRVAIFPEIKAKGVKKMSAPIWFDVSSVENQPDKVKVSIRTLGDSKSYNLQSPKSINLEYFSGPDSSKPFFFAPNKFSLGEETYISSAGLNANGHNIVNVADGEIREGSKEAINGGQLWAELQKLGKGGSIDMRPVYRVGAMSAALAGLQPLPYDKDHRLSVTAALGHYKAQNALSVGLGYYVHRNLRLNTGVAIQKASEKMFNVGVAYRFGGDSDSDDFIRSNELAHSRAEVARLNTLLEQSQTRELQMEQRFNQRLSTMQDEINELKRLIQNR